MIPLLFTCLFVCFCSTKPCCSCNSSDTSESESYENPSCCSCIPYAGKCLGPLKVLGGAENLKVRSFSSESCTHVSGGHMTAQKDVFGICFLNTMNILKYNKLYTFELCCSRKLRDLFEYAVGISKPVLQSKSLQSLVT